MSDQDDDEPVMDPGPGVDEHGNRLRRGGCACGAVRFELRGEPVRVGMCHCTKCRKATGAPFFHYANWPRAAFTSTGAFRTWKGRSFCGVCGTRLGHIAEDWVELALGALDEAPSGLAPSREGWIVRREHWLSPLDGAVQAQGDPPRA